MKQLKGLYEQGWKDAVKGAKITPSESLWDNIASNLDKEKGPNYWVTLLMIAATVTIALAFPLTIGNSSFETLPETNQPIAHSSTSDKNSLNQRANLSSNKNNAENNLLSNTTLENNDEANMQNYSAQLTKHDKKELSPTSLIIANNNSLIIKETETQGTGFEPFNWNSSYQLASLKNHYIIPYFMPINKSAERPLLASLTMGAGNTTTNGSNNTGSDMMALSNQNGRFSDTGEQIESKGTSFYMGAGIELPLGKRFSLLTGAGYLVQKAEGTNNVVRENNGSYKPVSIYDPIELGSVFLSDYYQYTTTNNYISIPISIKYPIINRKIIFRAGAGISTDFMLNHIVNAEAYTKATYKPDEVAYHAAVLTGLINLDASYSINKHYAIALETGIRKGITPIDKRKELYPSSFTAGIILFYKVQKN